MRDLQGDITRIQADLASSSQSINAQRQDVLALRLEDPAAYLVAVEEFNNRVVAYNTQATILRGVIEEYNQTVALRNAIALEERQLVEAIDTRSEPIIE